LKTKGSIAPVTNQYYLIKDEEGNRLIDNKGQLIFSNVEGWQLSAKSYLIIELENKSKKIIKL